MMQFIELTLADKRRVYINPNQINAIVESSTHVGTDIYLGTARGFKVIENIDDIMTQIRMKDFGMR